MKFIILGAGAIGCYVGGRLAANGQKVVLVGRSSRIAPLMQSGLTVSDLDGFNVHLRPDQFTCVPDLASAGVAGGVALDATHPTVILLCVKGGATASAAQEIAACCPKGTAVVSLQNGVDNVARIARHAPSARPLAGMVPYNVISVLAQGKSTVHRATAGQIHLADDPVTQQIAPVFNAAGLATTLHHNMLAVQWGKLLLNLNNPVNALSDLPLKSQLLVRDFRRTLAALQTEALGVLATAGITPAKVTSTPPRVLPHLLRLPDWLFQRLAARMLRMDASARSSMWDDVQHGRVTEIDDLCGAVVRLAAQHGTQAPLNAAMVHLMTRHTRDQRWTGAALYQHLLTSGQH